MGTRSALYTVCAWHWRSLLVSGNVQARHIESENPEEEVDIKIDEYVFDALYVRGVSVVCLVPGNIQVRHTKCENPQGRVQKQVGRPSLHLPTLSL